MGKNDWIISYAYPSVVYNDTSSQPSLVYSQCAFNFGKNSSNEKIGFVALQLMINHSLGSDISLIFA